MKQSAPDTVSGLAQQVFSQPPVNVSPEFLLGFGPHTAATVQHVPKASVSALRGKVDRASVKDFSGLGDVINEVLPLDRAAAFPHAAHSRLISVSDLSNHASNSLLSYLPIATAFKNAAQVVANKTSADLDATSDNDAMTNDDLITGWRDRLRNAIDRKGMSMRAVSLAADMAPSTVYSWLSLNKDPSVDNLAAVCRVIDIPLSEILQGYSITPEGEKILALLDARPDMRSLVLQLLQSAALPPPD